MVAPPRLILILLPLLAVSCLNATSDSLFQAILDKGDNIGLHEYLKLDPGSSELVLQHCRQAIDQYRTSAFQDSIAISYCYYKAGIKLGSLHRFDSAQQMFDQALLISERVLPTHHDRIYSIKMHQSDKYYLSDQLDLALSKAIESIELQLLSERTIKWFDTWAIVAVIFSQKGDLERANIAYDLAGGEFIETMAKRVLSYLSFGQPDEALQYLTSIPFPRDEQYVNLLARTYHDLDSLDKARKLYLEEIEMVGDAGLKSGYAHVNLADISLRQLDSSEAFYFLNRAREISTLEDDQLLSFATRTTAINIYAKYRSTESALLQDADFRDMFESTPKISFLNRVNYVIEHLERLRMAYAQNPSKYEEMVLANCDYYSNYLARTRMEFDKSGSSLKYGEIVREAYDLILQNLLAVSRREPNDLAFLLVNQAMEHNQANLQWVEIQRRLGERKYLYDAKIAHFREKFSQSSDSTPMERLTDSLAKYFLLDIKQAQRDSSRFEIKDKELIAQKIKGADNSYFLLTYQFSDSSHLITINSSLHSDYWHLTKEDYYALVAEWIKDVSEGNLKDEDLQDNFLYKFVSGYSDNEINNIVFIPDGLLANFPLDLLVCRQEFAKWNASYCQSISTFEPPVRSRDVDSVFLLAPTFTAEDWQEQEKYKAYSSFGLNPLKNNLEEVRTISKLIPNCYSVVLTDEGASLNEVNQRLLSFDVMHMATHAVGKVDGNMEPHILLAGGETVLFSEVSDWTLDAEMVVISACETGLGKFVSGEGVQSLARAFLHAGAKSVVASLWAADDQATSQIMIAFYELLKKGHRKDAALRLAKQKYLDDTAERRFQDPYYWSGFIAIGDMSSLDFRKSWAGLWMYSLGGVLMIFCLYYFGFLRG